MSYTITKFNGTELVVLEDGTIDTSTGVTLVGRNYTGYGELQNQNFVYLLENFSNDAPPSRPLLGQTWFDSTSKSLNVYDGEKWNLLGNAILSEEAPLNPASGTIWFDLTTDKLNFWAGQWFSIGPENTKGYGETRSKSTTLLSDTGQRYPVIMMMVDNSVVAIISSRDFTIASVERPLNFVDLIEGINLPRVSEKKNIRGNLDGAVSRADTLSNTRLINGVGFNGSRNIEITASSPFYLKKGDFIVGDSFNGSAEVTWSVDATSNNTIGTVVARDSAGNFSAGTISANLIGNVQGNITANTGTSVFNRIEANEFIGLSLSGNAATASILRTARKINGINFDGSQDITVPVNGEDITGTRLANTVVNSNLNTLGTLSELFINDTGLEIGSILKLKVVSGQPVVQVDNSQGLEFSVSTQVPTNYSKMQFISGSKNLSRGGDNTSALVPENDIDLGSSYRAFNKIYATQFIGTFEGTSSDATNALSAINLKGGSAGSIVYQSSTDDTSFVPPGLAGQVLKSGGTGQPTWGDISFATLTRGAYLTGSNYGGTFPTTWAVDATSANTAGKVVARDANGDFSARTITASLNGNANTATSATTAATANFATTAGTANTATSATTAATANFATTAGNANTVTSVTKTQIVNALGCDPCSGSGSGTSGVTLNTTQTITGQKTFTGGIISQAYNFNNNNSIFYANSPTRVQVAVNGSFSNNFYPGRFVVEGDSTGLSGEKAPGGVVVGVDGGTTGGAGVFGVHTNSRPGIGIGVGASAQNAAFTGAIFQGVTTRTKASNFIGLRIYTRSGLDPIFVVRGDGNVSFDGSFSTPAADYAEYFEWNDGNPNDEDRAGMTVSLIGNKIKIAEEGETIIGVVSVVPAVAGDARELEWQGKFLKDEFGRSIYESYTNFEWYDDDGKLQSEPSYGDLSRIPNNAVETSVDGEGNPLLMPKLNPNYDPNMTYIPRSKRKEWAAIGLVGKLKILKGQIVSDNWIKLREINNSLEEWLVR